MEEFKISLMHEDHKPIMYAFQVSTKYNNDFILSWQVFQKPLLDSMEMMLLRIYLYAKWNGIIDMFVDKVHEVKFFCKNGILEDLYVTYYSFKQQGVTGEFFTLNKQEGRAEFIQEYFKDLKYNIMGSLADTFDKKTDSKKH